LRIKAKKQRKKEKKKKKSTYWKGCPGMVLALGKGLLM